MSWPFLHVRRRGFRDDDNWGTLFIVDDAGAWQKLCHTYELPYIEDAKRRSKSKVSRIAEGEYELKVRTDGNKGWRLELQKTNHRKNIQVHRAHKSMYIEGCLLPVDFEDFENAPESGIGPVEKLKKGEAKIQSRSITLMQRIKARYEAVSRGKDGQPTILISATLPALQRGRATSVMFA